MFTRKHFVQEATRIYDIENPEEAWKEMDKYCDIFGASNPRFDQSKFMAACGFWLLEEDNEEESDEKNAKF